MQNKLTIIGCGGHAKSVADVALFNNPEQEIIFLDEKAKENEKIWGYNVLKLEEASKFLDTDLHIAIGDNSKRKLFYEKFSGKIKSITSKDAYIGKNVIINNGVFVAHNVFIGPESSIDNGCIINTNSTIEHDVNIGEFSFVGPGAIICGKTQIGENVFIGAGATLIDNIFVCSNVIIAAGACVTKHIKEEGLYAGIPARKIK